MPNRNEEQQPVSRRSFLRNVVLTAAAATAAGTGAAILSGKSDELIISSPTAPEQPVISSASAATQAQGWPTAAQAAQAQPPAGAPGAAGSGDALAQLAEAQAENVRLQAALDSAQRELEALRNANAFNSQTAEEVTLQLESANQQVGILAGLVALYEQLDDVDVTDAVEGGLAAVSQTIEGLIGQTPALSEGIQAGQTALAEVEAHLPTLEAGRAWLESQALRVNDFYVAVETVLQEVLESVGSFLQLVNDWFEGVRKWLPFGMGERAAQVVTALSNLVAETPDMVEGLYTQVAQPLDVWIGREEDEPRLQRRLIKPIRENVLTKAGETITQAQQVQTTYQTQLEQPLTTAVSQRKTLREQIAAYRQQYQV